MRQWLRHTPSLWRSLCNGGNMLRMIPPPLTSTPPSVSEQPWTKGYVSYSEGIKSIVNVNYWWWLNVIFIVIQWVVWNQATIAGGWSILLSHPSQSSLSNGCSIRKANITLKTSSKSRIVTIFRTINLQLYWVFHGFPIFSHGCTHRLGKNL